MITDDDLRALLTADDVPASLSPSSVRARAARIRRARRVSAVAVSVLVVPLLALVSIGLTGHTATSTAGGTGYPPAFDGDGHALKQRADGKVALAVPDVYASTGPSGLCWGGTTTSGVGGMCVLAPANAPADSGAGAGMMSGHGVIGSIAEVPLARADFVLGSHVAHAQVVGFSKYPNYRVLTAAWDGPDTGVMLRGWDASGRLILDVGCSGGCPAVAPLASGVPTPAPSSVRPLAVNTAVPDGRDFVAPGVAAWPTTDGICVGDQASTQCVTDGATTIDNGFSLSKDIAVTIVGKPLARAEFLVGTTPVEATVLGFASHPQWRAVGANLKILGAAGKSIVLRGWDGDGKLVLDVDPQE